MFAPTVAFVDLETTGTAAAEDRITEVGIVRVDDGARVSEWSTLVDPECSIPPEIQGLTGITNAMVAAPPTFRPISYDIAPRTEPSLPRHPRMPSLPPQLRANGLDAIPEAPGVYRFYGLNALPLYVGQSINLRERVASHFSSDYRSANDLRLSAEITRIEFEETAGEMGALLRESQLVKTLLPAYNQRLRRRAEMVALSIAAEPAPPDYVHASAIDPGALQDLYGPFSSRRQAREALRAVAGEAALCWTALGLERRQGPCFARQVKKCAGACVAAETPAAHHARLRDALAPYAIKRWPYPDTVGLRETSLTGERTAVHIFRAWCWL